eukprot:403334773
MNHESMIQKRLASSNLKEITNQGHSKVDNQECEFSLVNEEEYMQQLCQEYGGYYNQDLDDLESQSSCKKRLRLDDSSMSGKDFSIPALQESSFLLKSLFETSSNNQEQFIQTFQETKIAAPILKPQLLPITNKETLKQTLEYISPVSSLCDEDEQESLFYSVRKLRIQSSDSFKIASQESRKYQSNCKGFNERGFEESASVNNTSDLFETLQIIPQLDQCERFALLTDFQLNIPSQPDKEETKKPYVHFNEQECCEPDDSMSSLMGFSESAYQFAKNQDFCDKSMMRKPSKKLDRAIIMDTPYSIVNSSAKKKNTMKLFDKENLKIDFLELFSNENSGSIQILRQV